MWVDLVGMQLRWFDHWLKGEDNGVEQDKPVKLFVMGLDQGARKTTGRCPIRSSALTTCIVPDTPIARPVTAPLSTEVPADEGEDVYLLRSTSPGSHRGRSHLISLAMGWIRTARSAQRGVREDVLCYTTPPLEQPVE